MKFKSFRCLILAYFAVVVANSSHKSRSTEKHTDIVIVGGTGDLAKRYLWPGFFHLFKTHSNYTSTGEWTMRLIGAGISSVTDYEFHNMLDNCIACEPSDCNAKNIFINQAHYYKLYNIDDYKTLCLNIEKLTCTTTKHMVIFYLSVPSSTYGSIVQAIAGNCNLRGSMIDYKFAFEKPFGKDIDSAKMLASIWEEHLTESQIYRIDHYLGKQAIAHILKLRRDESLIERYLEKDYVKEIEVVVKETLGTKSRASFYDDCGVIRDMLQCHLTEIIALLTMDLSEHNSKRALLKSIYVDPKAVVLGQYEGYVDEVMAETNKTSTNTPTFAAVRLRIQTERWASVPVTLISGKKLNERVGFVRITFKNNTIHNLTTRRFTNECDVSKPQIIFHIGHGNLNIPAILISRFLYTHTISYIPNGWMETSKFDQELVYGSKGKCFRIYIPTESFDAYTFLISQIFHGNSNYFVSVDDLIGSWEVWTQILQNHEKTTPKLYPTGSTEQEILKNTNFGSDPNPFTNNPTTKRDSFLQHKLVTGTKEIVISTLARDILRAAQMNHNAPFHLALSGGSSPLALFDYLSKSNYDKSVWKHIHIWQVDERCLSEEVSNFKSLKSHLIDKITYIKDEYIHPMVDFKRNEVCTDKSADNYEKSLTEHTHSVRNSSRPMIDFILLGIGQDGHTASLFPRDEMLKENEKLVTTGNVKTDKEITSPRRMTLTYTTIKRSRNMAVLATGKSKCSILQKLMTLNKCMQNEQNTDISNQFPICGVLPISGNVRFYVDSNALSCHLHTEL